VEKKKFLHAGENEPIPAHFFCHSKYVGLEDPKPDPSAVTDPALLLSLLLIHPRVKVWFIDKIVYLLCKEYRPCGYQRAPGLSEMQGEGVAVSDRFLPDRYLVDIHQRESHLNQFL